MDVKRISGTGNITDALTVRDLVFTREQGFLQPDHDAFDTPSEHIVVYEQGRPVATGRCYADPDHPDHWHLGRICVLAEMRGRDLGLLIMRHLEEICREKGARCLVLGAQLHAVPFYEKCGFSGTGERYFDEHCEHENMQKQIPS